MIVTIIQLILFTFYVSFIWVKYGIQKSLSESWYTLESKYKWMFGVTLCFGIGILHCTHGTILFFLSGAALCFVGAASDYRSKRTTKIVHYCGAIIAMLTSVIGLCQLGVYWPTVVILFSILIFPILENRFWWIEIIIFYSVIIGIMTSL